MPSQERTLLLIADGWGTPEDVRRSAVSAESAPELHRLMSLHGFATLGAAEEAVGLEAGQPGNSEAGHLTIGAGRCIPSKLRAVAESFADRRWHRSAIWEAIRPARALHLVGLVSDAGVHGHLRTLIQASRVASEVLRSEIHVHAILDGVDSVAGSAPGLVEELQAALAKLPRVHLATVMGRKWATDRSGKLEITRQYADAVSGRSAAKRWAPEALRAHLEATGAESSFPCHLVEGGRVIGEGEPVLFTNHRADRTAQLAQVMAEHNPVFALVELATWVPADRVFFPSRPVERGLVTELRERGTGILRVAEHCKFPHVTFFLNGFHQNLGEEAICVPTIPEARIGEQPEMSIAELTSTIAASLARPEVKAMVANIPNLDQVGHTGRMDAARSAAGHVDRAVGRVRETCAQHGWNLVITGDHGNAEVMVDEQGEPWGSHTTNPVPFVVVPRPGAGVRWKEQRGTLANVAPTFLRLLGVQPPSWMEAPLAERV